MRKIPKRRRVIGVAVRVSIAVVLGLAAAIWWITVTGHPERRALLKKYGAPRYSQQLEELIVRDYFRDKRDGIFVDVGAAHYRDFSNTYYLESELGWSGLAVDPIGDYAADYTRHRPRSRFLPYFVAASSGGTETLHIPKDNWVVASAFESFSKREEPSSEMRVERVPVSTLDDLLKKEGVSRIDFLSIDVELSEPKVLAGFSIDSYRPALVCIEAHPDVRQAILDYFTAHRYAVVARYLRTDELNLWFQPLDVR
jgi:FkbM family methyltransferase